MTAEHTETRPAVYDASHLVKGSCECECDRCWQPRYGLGWHGRCLCRFCTDKFHDHSAVQR